HVSSHNLDLHSFPTRRSSDLTNVVWFESYNDAINNVNPLHGTHPLQNDKTYYGVIIGQGQCASLPFQVTVKIVLGLNDLDLTSRSEEHTSELQSRENLVCRLL